MILTKQDIEKYVPMQTSSFDFENYIGFENRALLAHLPRFLGAALILELQKDVPDADLLSSTKPVLANLTVLKSISFLDVVLTSSGFGVIRNNNIAPASKERVENFAQGCTAAANDYLDILLAWLEDNANSYSDWNKCSINEGSLIENTAVFNSQTKLNLKHHQFVDLKTHLQTLEVTYFANQLSGEFLTELQAGSDLVIKPTLQKALSFFAYSNLFDLEDSQKSIWEQKGKMFFNKAMATLITNRADYPTYLSYGYETPYDNDDDDNEDSGFFVAGPTA